MGILNVTPDSFSDGGRYFDPNKAVDRALRIVDEGADIIDIGGESTRPGSDPVSEEEELARTVPVIRAISAKTSIPISIDTCKSRVAKEAIEAGASIVNDVSGMTFDAEMTGVVAHFRLPVVIMHMKGRPKTMQENPAYDDLLGEIVEYFKERIRHAVSSGISEDMIILDPGIGFGKTFDHNLMIINNLDRFSELGRPILVGPSRKTFIGKILDGAPASERLEGTAAAVAVAIMRGAHIVRVHDIRQMRAVAKVADAIRRERIVSA